MTAPDKINIAIEGVETTYIKKSTIVDFIGDAMAENLENTTTDNHDNHEGNERENFEIV